jgi:hypothetical protein
MDIASVEPNNDEELVILGNACNGAAGFNCAASDLDFKLKYTENGEDVWVNGTFLGVGNDVTQSLSNALVGVAAVTPQGTSILVIAFKSSISSVLLLVEKVSADCNHGSIRNDLSSLPGHF